MIEEIDGSARSSLVLEPDAPTYGELLIERDRLLKENLRLSERLQATELLAQDYWQVVEDVACGATIDCVTCGKPKPCLCDK